MTGSSQPGPASIAIIEVPVVSDAIRALGVPLSPVTRAGHYVFVSGIPPIDIVTGELVGGDISTQCHAAMTALNACLAAAGTSMDFVASVKIYASNAGHYREINDAYRAHLGRHFPARTFVPVGSWPGKFDIEIECIAVTEEVTINAQD